MDQFFFISNPNIVNEYNLTYFNGNTLVPFPMNLSYEWRFVVMALFSFFLITGFALRGFIFAYLTQPDAKQYPINFLLLLDQTNGMIFALVLIFEISAIYLEYPLRDVLGDNFCKWIRFPVTAYSYGCLIWGCFIALYRMMYIKANNWFIYKVGEYRMLFVLTTVGLILKLSISFFMAEFDNDSSISKHCTFWTKTDLDLIQEFKVSLSLL
jgi:hypothetical protein